jgi:repressor LexA
MSNEEGVWRFINKFRIEKGYSPSHQEIADGVGIKSKSSVHHCINKLEKRGWVERVPGKIRSVKGTRWQ